MTSGFRTFTAGEVLTASNVQNYLMDQSVMTFAGSAARSSAIGTANFEEGMTSYLKDTDKLEVYNGTNWVGVAPTTTQGLTLINTTSFSGVTSVSLPAGSFTSTYDNYRIVLRLTTTGNATISARLRASGSDASTNNYNTKGVYGGSSGINAWNNAGTSAWLNYTCNTNTSNISMDLFSPQKTETTLGLDQIFSASTGDQISQGLEFTLTTSFDSLSFIASTGNISGTVRVYGYNQ